MYHFIYPSKDAYIYELYLSLFVNLSKFMLLFVKISCVN